MGPAQVLRSAAGWYVGSLYWDDELEAWLPYARYSPGYYATEAEAQVVLSALAD